MLTRPNLSRAVAAALSAALLAACGDTATPTAPSVPARVAAPSFDIAGTNVPVYVYNDTAYAKFTVNPAVTQTFVLAGKNAIAFPASGICEPSTSSYGVGTWDDPCVATTRSITVSLKAYYDALGRRRVEFSPALRFNPSSTGVFLYLDPDDTESHSGPSIDPWFKSIYYCPDFGPCVDESLLDPSQKTFYDESRDLLGRRIKHFSGYTVEVG